jgi:CubicO group peptidase (beta-lactamase class C family)
MTRSDPIGAAMERAVVDGVFPGAVLLVRVRGELAYCKAVGRRSLVPSGDPVTLETVYDLASLTKPLATTSAVLLLVQQGKLDITSTVQDLLPELAKAPIGEATVFHMLTHSAGLPGWRPFYERIAAEDERHPGFLGSSAVKEAVLGYIRDEALLHPVGTRCLYSDLGFMVLGMLVERVSHQSFASFCREQLYEPTGATPLAFLEVGSNKMDSLKRAGIILNQTASTEEDSWRGRIVLAEVHDENAYALGGVAGHAGLFGTASAVLAMSGAWVNAHRGRRTVFDPSLVRQFVMRQTRIPQSSWALGWDTPSAPSSSGTKFSAQSFGHLGYTGTSLWVDPVCELEVVLLSNRVHPTRRNELIRQFRPQIHDLIYEEFVH